jgi:type VI protein secretion system component Hcp
VTTRSLIRIDGVYQLLLPGNVIRGKEKWSEITSFSFGNEGASQGGATRPSTKTRTTSIIVTRVMSASSSKLAQAASEGTNIGTVFILVVQRKGSDEVAMLGYRMNNVSLSSYATSSGRPEAAQESITLNFNGITIL